MEGFNELNVREVFRSIYITFLRKGALQVGRLISGDFSYLNK